MRDWMSATCVRAITTASLKPGATMLSTGTRFRDSSVKAPVVSTCSDDSREERGGSSSDRWVPQPDKTSPYRHFENTAMHATASSQLRREARLQEVVRLLLDELFQAGELLHARLHRHIVFVCDNPLRREDSGEFAASRRPRSRRCRGAL